MKKLLIVIILFLTLDVSAYVVEIRPYGLYNGDPNFSFYPVGTGAFWPSSVDVGETPLELSIKSSYHDCTITRVEWKFSDGSTVTTDASGTVNGPASTYTFQTKENGTNNPKFIVSATAPPPLPEDDQSDKYKELLAYGFTIKDAGSYTFEVYDASTGEVLDSQQFQAVAAGSTYNFAFVNANDNAFGRVKNDDTGVIVRVHSALTKYVREGQLHPNDYMEVQINEPPPPAEPDPEPEPEPDPEPPPDDPPPDHELDPNLIWQTDADKLNDYQKQRHAEIIGEIRESKNDVVGAIWSRSEAIIKNQNRIERNEQDRWETKEESDERRHTDLKDSLDGIRSSIDEQGTDNEQLKEIAENTEQTANALNQEGEAPSPTTDDAIPDEETPDYDAIETSISGFLGLLPSVNTFPTVSGRNYDFAITLPSYKGANFSFDLDLNPFQGPIELVRTLEAALVVIMFVVAIIRIAKGGFAT